MTPAIDRLHPNDDVEPISAKLIEENKANVDTEYKKSKHYQAERLRVSIRSSYGCIQSPKACNDLQVELGKITLGGNQYTGYQRFAGEQESSAEILRHYEGSTYTESSLCQQYSVY